jgi:predicted transcriptional regulator
MGQDDLDPILPLTAKIVSAYVGRHDIEPDALPELIRTVYDGLKTAHDTIAKPSRQPAVPIDESITDTHIICLEDGKSFQSLKRHLRVAFNLTPEDYRARWGLPDDYPMVAPAYARRRSALAKKAGLGRKP